MPFGVRDVIIAGLFVALTLTLLRDTSSPSSSPCVSPPRVEPPARDLPPQLQQSRAPSPSLPSLLQHDDSKADEFGVKEGPQLSAQCERLRQGVSLLRPPHNHSLVVFTSFPRSGNTWMRQMMEMATGIMTGSVYPEVPMRLAGLYGGYQLENVLCVKTHAVVEIIARDELIKKIRAFDLSPLKGDNATRNRLIASSKRARYPQAILHLVRHPFDSIWSISQFHRTHFGHTVKLPLPHQKTFLEYLKIEIHEWRLNFNFWSREREKKPSLLIRYEDLVTDTNTTLLSALNFLRVKTTPERLACAIESTKCDPSIPTNVCREKNVGGEALKYYSKEARQLMLKGLFREMTILGYNTNITLEDGEAIAAARLDPAQSSIFEEELRPSGWGAGDTRVQ